MYVNKLLKTCKLMFGSTFIELVKFDMKLILTVYDFVSMMELSF